MGMSTNSYVDVGAEGNLKVSGAECGLIADYLDPPPQEDVKRKQNEDTEMEKIKMALDRSNLLDIDN